ncbi:MAG: hypothetical protein HC780_12215 [Leptolyngbyaceae cyanobacterium CSU_1_3]|nr:hypothetical protein [Leptolyngbyaceae cyanobacterium CSU_1_3]
MFAWGCVYQCHGSHDQNLPTFGTGSLFSMRKAVANHFRFDTNIRYFRTYGCEEHDFARRLQSCGFEIFRAEQARANHYQAPAKDRAWRGLGGDLNYLYEQTKRGSIWSYYSSLASGILFEIQHLIAKSNAEKNLYQNPYKEAIQAFHRSLILIREGRITIAVKYLYYVFLIFPCER